MTDGEHPSAKQDLLSRLCSALISVCSFLQNASKNRLVTRVLTQQKTIYILFQAYPRMLGELSILLTRCANSDARYRTQPASKEHTVFHMYGTYILPYANMCCNCCCCQHPPTGCIICSVRNNQADAWRTFEALRLELAYNSTILLLRQGGNALLIPYYPKKLSQEVLLVTQRLSPQHIHYRPQLLGFSSCPAACPPWTHSLYSSATAFDTSNIP